VIASLRMVDDTIVGSVNSAERAEEVVELLAEHVPDAQHVNTEVLDLDDVDEADRPAPNDQAEMLAQPRDPGCDGGTHGELRGGVARQPRPRRSRA
jgi:hypothetical protein